jgi:hypothetical protein
LQVPGDYGWVAPTYNVAERGREAFMAAAAPWFLHFVGRTPSRVEFRNEDGELCRVWFLSADNPVLKLRRKLRVTGTVNHDLSNYFDYS